MNLLALAKIFVFTLLAYAICIDGGAVYKREAADDSSNSQTDNSVKKFLSGFPVLGNLFGESFEYAQNVSKANITEQSAYFGRAMLDIVNNILPCKITVQNITCEGLEQNGGIMKIAIDAFRNIPGGIFNGSPITKVVSLFDSERGSQLSQPSQKSQQKQNNQPILPSLKGLFPF